MALKDRLKRTRNETARTGADSSYATIDAAEFDSAKDDGERQRLMKAADRYNAASKQRPRAS